MRIFVFSQSYPVPYKPYYDTQFADLMDKGHELTIFAHSPLDGTANERFRAYQLNRQIRRYPTTLRTLARYLPSLAAAGVRCPGGALAALKIASEAGPTVKRRITDSARALVVQSARPDLCLIHGLGTAAWFSWLKRLFPIVPVAMYYHGGEVPSVAELPSDAVTEVFKSMDVVFTNTRFSARHAVGRGCAPEKIVVLPVGFALEDFVPDDPRLYRRDGILRFLSAGRMSEEKGFIYALRAVKLLVDRGITDIHYSLTGDGYLRPSLEQFVAENDLGAYVSFLGTLTTEGVLKAMKEADVLLLSSIQVGNWVENQACAVQEAMLMKALPITTRTGGVPESIPSAMQPWSVPPENPEALATAMAQMYTLSLAELRALGEECRSFVVQRYDIRKLNSQMLDVALGRTAAAEFTL